MGESKHTPQEIAEAIRIVSTRAHLTTDFRERLEIAAEAYPMMLEALRRITQRASEPRSTTAGAVPVCTVPWALIEEAVAIIRDAEGKA